MSEERVQFIKEQLAAGKTVDDIRREAISHGHGTDGFDDDFVTASAGAPTPGSVATEGVPPPAPAASDTAVPAPAAVPAPDQAVPGPAQPLIGAIELITESFKATKDHLSLIGGFFLAALGLLAVGGGVAVLVTTMFGASLMGASGVAALVPILLGVALYLAWLIAFVIAVTGLMYAIVKRREQVGYWQGVRWAASHFWSIFWVSLLLQLVISGGYVFLVIPGLVVALYTSFALYALIGEQQTGLKALLRSTELVYGHWWGVLLRAVLFILALVAVGLVVGFLAGLLSGLISAITGPNLVVATIMGVVFGGIYFFALGWGAFFAILLFESLQQLKPTAGNLWDTMKTTRIIYIVLAVIGVPAMILIQSLSFYDGYQDTTMDGPELIIGTDGLSDDWSTEFEAELQEEILRELEGQNGL